MRVARLVALALLLVAALDATAQDWTPRDDWARLFTDAGVEGTLAVVDERDGTRYVHDPQRAQRRFVPASTFKLPHLLFALDAGLAKDEFQTFRWDGTQRRFAHWNRD